MLMDGLIAISYGECFAAAMDVLEIGHWPGQCYPARRPRDCYCIGPLMDECLGAIKIIVSRARRHSGCRHIGWSYGGRWRRSDNRASREKDREDDERSQEYFHGSPPEQDCIPRR